MAALLHTTILLIYLLPQAMFEGTPNVNEASRSRAINLASTYVPIESWVYPAFDRLAAEGYLPEAMVSLRPWTRMACTRMLQEAEDRVIPRSEHSFRCCRALLRGLRKEFAVELQQIEGARNAEFRPRVGRSTEYFHRGAAAH